MFALDVHTIDMLENHSNLQFLPSTFRKMLQMLWSAPFFPLNRNADYVLKVLSHLKLQDPL